MASDTVCDAANAKNYVLRTELTCDADKTDAPTNSDWSVVKSGCEYIVTGSHAAGCPYIPVPLDETPDLDYIPTFRTGKI